MPKVKTTILMLNSLVMGQNLLCEAGPRGRPPAQPSDGNCQCGLRLSYSVLAQPAWFLLQIGSINPSYDKIFSHLQRVKYKGEGFLAT